MNISRRTALRTAICGLLAAATPTYAARRLFASDAHALGINLYMDVGWVVAAGHDPVQLLKAYPGRFRLMHVKDVASTHRVNTELRIVTTEVGTGIIDWQRVLTTAVGAGVEHFAVEQEPPYAMPELEAARKSYAYLNRLEI